jgi:hypothetical protein
MVVACCRVLSHNLPSVTEESCMKPQEGSQSPSQDLKSGPPGFKARVLTTPL